MILTYKNGLKVEDNTPSRKYLIKEKINGIYTGCRSINKTSIVGYESHINRLCNAGKLIKTEEGDKYTIDVNKNALNYGAVEKFVQESLREVMKGMIEKIGFEKFPFFFFFN